MGRFVGRDQELNLLMSRWQQALRREGQVVFLSGEAGIGKSRLLEVLLEKVADTHHELFRLYCSPYHTGSPLYPVLERLNRQAGLATVDSTADKRQRVEHLLLDEYRFSKDAVAVFAALTSLGLELIYPPPELGPQQQLGLFRDAIVNYLMDQSEVAPVLVVVEDLHWIDPTSRTLLEQLIARVSDKKVFLLLSSRPDNPPTMAASNVTRLALNRLETRQVSELIDDLSHNSALSESVVEKIKAKCDGVPLYIEEITKMILDVDDPGASAWETAVPESLQASLLARLDRLGEAREITQIASVVGSGITTELIAALSNISMEAIAAGFDSLIRHKVMGKSAVGGVTCFEFRHALLKDAAYGSLLRNDRVRLHRKIAHYLSDADPGLIRNRLGIIAWHYSEGGEPENAFQFWLKAGQAALDTGATLEAISLLNNARSSVSEINSDQNGNAVRQSDLYALHMARGKALNAAHGAASIDAHDSFRQAQTISEKFDDIARLVDSLDYQMGITFNAGLLTDSLGPAKFMIDIGTERGELLALVSGHQGLGMIQFAMGEFEQAKYSLQECIGYRDQDVSGVNCYPSMAMTYLSYVYYIMGDSAAARTMCDDSVHSARSESPRSVASALSNCCNTLQFLGDPQTMLIYAEELIELAHEKGMYMYKNRGHVFRSLAEAQLKHEQESLVFVEEAVEALLQAGEEIETTCLLGVTAELWISFEKFDRAGQLLQRARGIAERNNELFYMAELMRLEGALLIAAKRGAVDQAGGWIKRAIELATRQGAERWRQRALEAMRILTAAPSSRE